MTAAFVLAQGEQATTNPQQELQATFSSNAAHETHGVRKERNECRKNKQ